MKKVLMLFLLLLLVQPGFALELKFKEAKKATQVGTIKLTNNNQDFNAGEYNFSLPERSALSSAGLDATNSGITIQCYSKSNNKWYLYIASNGFSHTDPRFLSTTIPRDNFQWLPSYAGVWDNNNSKWIGSDTSQEMRSSLAVTSFTIFTATDQLMYASNSIDTNHSTLGNSTGTEIQMLLGVSVPEYQTAGTYEADLVFSLTE